MKHSDIQKLHDAGLITDEQRQKIIEHFQLKEDGGNKFLAIVSIIGAVLIAAGIALLISAHWNEIPRGVKIAAGHSAHARLPRRRLVGARSRTGKYRKTGEALHLIGSVPVPRQHRAHRPDLQHRLAPAERVSALVDWHRRAAVAAALQGAARFAAARLRHLVRTRSQRTRRLDLLRHDERQILLYSLLGLVYLGAGCCCGAARLRISPASRKSSACSPSWFLLSAHVEGFFRLAKIRNQQLAFPRARPDRLRLLGARPEKSHRAHAAMAMDVVRRAARHDAFHGDGLVRPVADRLWRRPALYVLGRIVDLPRGHPRAVRLLPAANPGRPAGAFAVSREPRRRVHRARHHRGLFQFVRLDGADGR